MAVRWGSSRTPHSSSLQCTISHGGIYPSPVSHRTLTATEQPVSGETSGHSRLRVWSGTRNHHTRYTRMSPPTRETPSRCRGSRTQVERPVLYTWGAGPLGRSKNWTASRWTKGKMESGHPGGTGDSQVPLQDRKVRCASKDGRVKGS
jgi:hypothetical protein